MSWRDLLAKPDESVVVPWTGGREVRAGSRVFSVKGRLPPEHGWHTFKVDGSRVATWTGAAEGVDLDAAFGKQKLVRGYLVADRLVPDGASVVLDPTRIVEQTETVWLIEPGLDRFARIRAGRWPDGRLIYVGQEFPLGPEAEVTDAYLDQKASVTEIKEISPALDLAFRFETWNRIEQARLRAEAERLAREEAERLAREEQRANLVRRLGTGEGRRQMAAVDFETAARAALRVAGAEFLDYRDTRVAGEAVVHFRYRNRKWECVAQKATLRIVDAGVCLINHATGERGDTKFTLESLPAVLSEAIDTGRLVVFRHVEERGGHVREDDEGGRFHADDDPDWDEEF